MLSERLHPTTDGNRCRDVQPDVRQNLGHPVREWEEELTDREVKNTTRKPYRIN